MTEAMTPSSQSSPECFFNCLHSERFHSLFSSVEAGLNRLCNFHQANKGKQWYKSVKSARRFLHLTLCFTQACNDPLLNAGKAAFDFHPFWSPFEWKYLIFCLCFPSPLIHRLKALTAFWRTFLKYAEETHSYHSSALWYSERTTNHLGC